LSQNPRKYEILDSYKDVSKTNKEIIAEFFPNTPEKKMALYLKALYFVAKENL
jgi:hypothetical protein